MICFYCDMPDGKHNPLCAVIAAAAVLPPPEQCHYCEAELLTGERCAQCDARRIGELEHRLVTLQSIVENREGEIGGLRRTVNRLVKTSTAWYESALAAWKIMELGYDMLPSDLPKRVSDLKHFRELAANEVEVMRDKIAALCRLISEIHDGNPSIEDMPAFRAAQDIDALDGWFSVVRNYRTTGWR